MLRNRMGKLVGLVLVGFLEMSFVGCSSVENIDVEDTKPIVEETTTVEEEEVEEVTLVEYNADAEYQVLNTRNDLKKCTEGDNVELVGEVGVIQENGTMTIKFQLDTDDEDGFSIEVNVPKEGLESLKRGDMVKVQGTYRGVQAWSLNRPGENYGAHQLNGMNIYLIK